MVYTVLTIFQPMKQTDYLVIGAGIAGLTTAYLLSHLGDVLVVTKGKMKQSNTYWAQGGIAAVMNKEDSFDSHIKDTLKAGAGHCNESAVRHLVEHAPKAIRFLESIGVYFQEDLALEGGHSCPRVLHSSDYTGQDILNALLKACKKQRSIKFQEDSDVVEFITYEKICKGAFVRQEEGDIAPIFAKHTILATGGLGQLFGRTTNTIGSGGDGISLAVNAGLPLQDMEFVQFHPTAFAEPVDGRFFLLSEALRGFGAYVVNKRGERFLKNFDPRGELAPRDLVARAIYFEQMNGPVYLEMQHLDHVAIKKRFPNIYKWVKQHGYDLAEDLVPITPVAHYACGGIPVDLKGATELPGLFAVGEVACTGVHGANRLASNSLLEAVVFSQAVAETLEKSRSMDEKEEINTNIPLAPAKISTESIRQVKAYAQRIGKVMWEKVGIVRTKSGLTQAKKDLNTIPARDYRVQNRQLVCYKIIEACLSRSESLGTHYMTEEIV